MARPRSEPLPEAPPADGADGATPGAGESEKARESQRGPSVALPTERTVPSGKLEDKTVVIYGPPKIGKSTLTNQFGDVLFLDTEGGLTELPVYPVPVTSWPEFLAACAEVVKPESRKKWPVVAIDTLGRLAAYCSAEMNAKMGVMHESDLEYGKGWNVVRNEMERALAKLAATPGLGLVLVCHSEDVEIKGRNRTITKSVPKLPKAAREIALGMADLILFCDYEEVEEGQEKRVLRTKASAYWEAGERGNPPRLPETIDMSYEALVKAWAEGGKDA